MAICNRPFGGELDNSLPITASRNWAQRCYAPASVTLRLSFKVLNEETNMNTIDSIQVRNGIPSDYENVISVMPNWWGGRDLSSSVLKLFFIHFCNTTFIAEMNRMLVGFLVGFFSQSEKNVGYIHIAGVHPNYRNVGIGRLLYHHFFKACEENNISLVKSCTSPINKLSINFHQHMGFIIEPGDGIVDGLPVVMNFLEKNDPKVLFIKELSRRKPI